MRKSQSPLCRMLAPLALAALTVPAIAQQQVTFDTGPVGWSVSGRDDIASVGGNPGANMQVLLIDVFGADIRTSTNIGFVGDYTQYASGFEVSVDIKVNSIFSSFGPGELPRELIVEFRDYDNALGFPWTSVWMSLGILDASVNNDWVTYSATIADPFATSLPSGWNGYGDEDPNTFEPILPPGRTFTSVLASVDELAFTTFVPGFFFGFTNFDMQVDNIKITPTIIPACNPADLNSAGAPNPTVPGFGFPDGILSPTDFAAFAGFFQFGDLRADLNDASAPNPSAPNFGTPDGILTPTDFSAFAAYFSAGCPCTLPGCP